MLVRRFALVLLALTGVVALLMMHGLTAHGAGPAHAAATASGGSAHHAAAPPTGHGHGAGSEHRDHPDQPVPPGGHGAAALCALIVLGLAVGPRRADAATGHVAVFAPRPRLRAWSPDPPVPKPRLVLHAT